MFSCDLSTVQSYSLIDRNTASGNGGAIASIGNSFVYVGNGAKLRYNSAILHGGCLYAGGLGATLGLPRSTRICLTFDIKLLHSFMRSSGGNWFILICRRKYHLQELLHTTEWSWHIHVFPNILQQQSIHVRYNIRFQCCDGKRRRTDD